MFGWHIELKHIFYKSRRDEWTLRWWKPVKYVRPIAPYKVEPKSYVDGFGEVHAWPEVPDGEGVKE